MNNKKRCGVIGNPISHSQSPKIHHRFANRNGIEIQYDKFLVTEENLSQFVINFFKNGGTGLNVTLPFKRSIIKSIDQLSNTAKLCQSVNTLYLNQQNEICGETTDGDGLLIALEKLDFEYKNKNILIVGAGGASVSVVCSLLQQKAKIRIVNRSQNNISQLVEQFSDVGDVSAFELDETLLFDGVICAISQANESIYQTFLPKLKSNTFIYDLNYQKRAQETLNYFRRAGFLRLSDGYGMLIGQAAKSFEIWHNVLPTLDQAFERLWKYTF